VSTKEWALSNIAYYFSGHIVIEEQQNSYMIGGVVNGANI
jgi:hypothetical protein